jgi:hypothetical protein
MDYVTLEHQRGIRDASDVPKHVLSRCEMAIPSIFLLSGGSLSVNQWWSSFTLDGRVDNFRLFKGNMPGTHAYKHWPPHKGRLRVLNVVLRTCIGGAGSIKPLTLVVSSQANYSRHFQDGHLTSTQDDFVLLSHQQDKTHSFCDSFLYNFIWLYFFNNFTDIYCLVPDSYITPLLVHTGNIVVLTAHWFGWRVHALSLFQYQVVTSPGYSYLLIIKIWNHLHQLNTEAHQNLCDRTSGSENLRMTKTGLSGTRQYKYWKTTSNWWFQRSTNKTRSKPNGRSRRFISISQLHYIILVHPTKK